MYCNSIMQRNTRINRKSKGNSKSRKLTRKQKGGSLTALATIGLAKSLGMKLSIKPLVHLAKSMKHSIAILDDIALAAHKNSRTNHVKLEFPELLDVNEIHHIIDI